MFLEKVFSGKNDIGRWIALIMIVMTGIFVVGLIPLKIAMFLKLNDNPDLVPDPENPFDFWSYDISPVTGLALTTFPFVIGLLALLFLIRPVHERPVISLFTGGESFRWKRFFWAISMWLLLLVLYSSISIAAGIQKIQTQFNLENLIYLIIVSLVLLTIKAVFEETFFRGYLMQGFTKLFLNRWMPALATSILFAGFYYFYPEVKAFGLRILLPHCLWFGIFLGICTIMDEGVEIALGIHVINSIFFAIFFTDQSNATQTPAVFNILDTNSFIELIGLLLISLLFLQFARRKFSWPDWNYLFSKIEEPEISEEMNNEDYGFLEEDEDNERY